MAVDGYGGGWLTAQGRRRVAGAGPGTGRARRGVYHVRGPRTFAIRAGRLFDSAAGRMMTTRWCYSPRSITAVGPAGTVTIPAGPM